MKCDDCKKKEAIKVCECCGKPVNDTCTPPTVYRNDYGRPEHDDFGDFAKAFRDRNGRNPRGEEWAMFI